MPKATINRPPLPTSDTLDQPRLVGSLAGDGVVAVQKNGGSANEKHGSLTSNPMTEDEFEDYDTLSVDPDTIIEGSHGGALGDGGMRMELDGHNDGLERRRSTQTNGKSRSRGDDYGRAGSIQVRLEKTDQKGRYVLTADDPEVRDILRMGREREEAAAGGQNARARTRFRDLVFTRQFTTFDRQNPLSKDSPFHGFFTLFWLAMVLMFIKVAATNWRKYGSVLGQNEVIEIMFSRDVVVLGMTDIAMLFSTSFCLLLQKAILAGYLTWNGSGWIIQNVWQAFFLFSIIGWTLYRDWPWTHTIFMVIHTLAFIMKQHSYGFYNGHLSNVYRRRRMLERKLKQLEDLEPSMTSPVSASSSALSAQHSSSTDLKGETQRPPILRTATNLTSETSDVATVASAMEAQQSLDADQKQAFERVIKAEIETLNKELSNKCTTPKNAYPNNLNFSNFADWCCLPTLVYELEYPRQEHINWWYVAEKTAATFGTIGVMMVISQAYIYPPVLETVRMKEAGMSLQERWKELPWIVSDMLFPLLLEQLLTWYVIWECVLNVLAELTRFADRGFYGDWWNSVSWDQYARDWNRPVHNFLLRHVYFSSISAFHLSKGSATFVTFLLSALVHELVMACLFKKVRGYLFTMQLLQLPLVSLSRTPLMKGQDLLGNVVFWIGLFVGPSVLTSFYLLI